MSSSFEQKAKKIDRYLVLFFISSSITSFFPQIKQLIWIRRIFYCISIFSVGIAIQQLIKIFLAQTFMSRSFRSRIILTNYKFYIVGELIKKCRSVSSSTNKPISTAKDQNQQHNQPSSPLLKSSFWSNACSFGALRRYCSAISRMNGDEESSDNLLPTSFALPLMTWKEYERRTDWGSIISSVTCSSSNTKFQEGSEHSDDDNTPMANNSASAGAVEETRARLGGQIP
jgi:hypothetical protein